MKSNLLEKTTELLSSNESRYYKHNTYLPNNKMKAKIKINDNSNESKPQLEDSFSHYVGELDYYKSMITKMNSDIGDINIKLQSIDNSLCSSIISGNPESLRTIQEIAPYTDRTQSFYANFHPTPQKNNKKEIKETPKKPLTQHDLNEKEKRLMELEMNSKSLLEKNKELENQLSVLNNIINEPDHIQETPKLITETNYEAEINITEPYQTKSIITTDNDNQNVSAKTIPTPTTKIDNNGCSTINLEKRAKKKHKDHRGGITSKEGYRNHQKQKRSNSARDTKLLLRTHNEDTIKGKPNEVSEMVNQNSAVKNNQQQITFTPNKEQYYDNERKQYIDKLNYLESSFNNQIRALNQKYQSTIEKQDSRIKKLIKENENLKLKINQIKTIMK